MKRIFYFFKSYQYDLIAAVFLVGSAIFSYFIRDNQKISFYVSVVIIIISLIVIIYLRIREKSFYFIPFTNRKDKDDWIGKGIFDYSRVKKCFQITDSDSGYIYSKCFMWSDYQISFDFKIINSCFGVIVRAINLSNYVMLQIGQDGIRPHIKINSAWKAWEYKEVDLGFETQLKLDKWYKSSISCEKDTINIKIFGNDIIFDRDWIIPSGQINFVFEIEENSKKPIVIPFAINLEYGTVGFRNCGSEKAIFRNVLIQRI